jgi:hypothetical protein
MHEPLPHRSAAPIDVGTVHVLHRDLETRSTINLPKIGAHKYAATYGLFQDLGEVNARLIEVFRAVIKILRIYKYAYPLCGMFYDCHTNNSLNRTGI